MTIVNRFLLCLTISIGIHAWVISMDWDGGYTGVVPLSAIPITLVTAGFAGKDVPKLNSPDKKPPSVDPQSPSELSWSEGVKRSAEFVPKPVAEERGTVSPAKEASEDNPTQIFATQTELTARDFSENLLSRASEEKASMRRGKSAEQFLFPVNYSIGANLTLRTQGGRDVSQSLYPQGDKRDLRSAAAQKKFKKAAPIYQNNPLPSYPLIARRRHWEGVVLLRVSVSPSGSVEELVLERSSGYQVLDQSARETVSRWLFYPALHNGEPTACQVRIPVSFELDKG